MQTQHASPHGFSKPLPQPRGCRDGWQVHGEGGNGSHIHHNGAQRLGRTQLNPQHTCSSRSSCSCHVLQCCQKSLCQPWRTLLACPATAGNACIKTAVAYTCRSTITITQDQTTFANWCAVTDIVRDQLPTHKCAGKHGHQPRHSSSNQDSAGSSPPPPAGRCLASALRWQPP